MVTQASAAPVGPLRRVPVQERSLARVQRMLDACADLIDEVGYESLSTTMLAERAGVAIGSVYQFFPDKRAIVAALAMRNLDLYVERMEARLASGTLSHWWEAVDAAIDEFIDMHRTVPGFRILHFGDIVDSHLLDEERDNDAVLAASLVGFLATGFGMEDSATLRFTLTIAVQTADALTKLAFKRDPAGDELVLAEGKDIVRDYLYRKLG